MSNKKTDIETIFLTALRIESSDARERYLQNQCGEDSDLRRKIESRLSADSLNGDSMEQTLSHVEKTGGTVKTGNMIGPYKLMDQIGEGGMGAVFIAEQREPVKRRVALKVIKPGMDTKEVMARFSAERQALAMMDHQNIAKVLDAGETELGRPFFVMELVKGVSITEFCDQHRLTYRERLELFLDVCNAIQHAHQKGVIHRDIKPSNVLVSYHDGKPVVKVIDFGVAKAINQQLTDATVFTQVSQMVGTPLYMSPEQAGLSGLDVDTRTDIYSLGVLLYELLTGQTPFDKQRLRKAALDEIRRIIREEDPPRPSTRISTLGESASTVSEHRKMEPKKMQQELRGEIDWIIMKSLEKDRQRRYETANGFALDVERYLRQEPVMACPPSAMYRLKKFAMRNRTGVVAASLIALALVLGIIGTGSGMIWALTEKERADEVAKIAVAKEKTTRGILDFLVGLFEEASPAKRLGKPMTVSEFLDVGASRIGELADEPDTLATLQETIGFLYVVLSDFEKSERLLLDAYEYRKKHAQRSEQDEIAFASAATSLAGLYQWTAPDKAEVYAKEASSIFESKLGDSPELADSLDVLGNSFQRQDKIEESLEAHRQSLAIREKLWPKGHEKYKNVATALHNIGIAYYFDNDLENAEKHYRRAIGIEQELLPADDPGLATSKHVLSIVFADQSKFENARRWQLESFRTRKKVHSADHDHVGLSYNWLGNIYRGLKRYTESEPMLRKAVEIHTKVYGKEDELVFWDRECLLKTLIKLEKFDEAIELQKQLAEDSRNDGGIANRRSVNNLLGEIQFALGNLDISRKTYQATADMGDDSTESMDRFVAVSKLKLAVIDAMQARDFSRQEFEDAVEFLVEKEKWAEADARLLQLKIDVADALFEAGKSDAPVVIYVDVKQKLNRWWRPRRHGSPS